MRKHHLLFSPPDGCFLFEEVSLSLIHLTIKQIKITQQKRKGTTWIVINLVGWAAPAAAAQAAMMPAVGMGFWAEEEDGRGGYGG